MKIQYSKRMTKVDFHDPYYVPDGTLIFSIISARYMNKWIFVRHKKRLTWEIPGGHIEPGETSAEAASRELMEETGAVRFQIDCVATYSVKKNGITGFGRLYFAEVFETGSLPDGSEIGEVSFLDVIPENLTHPDVQPHLFRKVLEYLKNY